MDAIVLDAIDLDAIPAPNGCYSFNWGGSSATGAATNGLPPESAIQGTKAQLTVKLGEGPAAGVIRAEQLPLGGAGLEAIGAEAIDLEATEGIVGYSCPHEGCSGTFSTALKRA
jgi:hypothetical protein